VNEPEADTTPGNEAQLFGPYRLCFEIASGGMASVFLGVKEGPNGFAKRLAIKRVHQHLAADSEFVTMFLDEALIASSIHHPNVCEVLDSGEVDGTHFLAMEYLMGEPLRAIQRALADVELPRRQIIAARIIADACEGLHAAHELRDRTGSPMMVVHRDVSPQNVMVTYDGCVKVMDFGIATARNRLHHTNTGVVKGKFAYMAPEQLRGHEVDRRADVWSLGVLLCETISVKRMFGRKNDSETILAVLNGPLPHLSIAAPGASDELGRIVANALRRDPTKRYATAAEMSRDLRTYLASSKELMDQVELARWMKEVFPKGLAEKQQLVALASQAPIPVPRVPKREHASASSSVELASLIRSRDGAGGTLLRRGGWVAAGALVLCLAVVGAAIALSSGDPEDAELAAAEPEAASTERAPSRERELAAEPPLAAEQIESPTVEASPAEASPAEASPAEASPAEASSNASTMSESVVEVAPPQGTETVETPTVEAHEARLKARRIAAPPDRPAEALPTGTGTVDIATPGGWADVYSQGRRLGNTPGRFRLPAGRQSIEIRPFGGAAARRIAVNVRANENVRVRVDVRAP
jgi:serine/threonine protein kinase